VSFVSLSDQDLFELLCVLIAVLGSLYALHFLLRRLGQREGELRIARPIYIGFALRFAAAVGLGQVAISRDLRGGDELTFLARAEDVSALPLGGADSLDKLSSELHTFLFSLHYRIFDVAPPELMLRIEMVLFATVGVALMAAAVHELAGARAGAIAAWVLALEPATLFFSSLLHKEPIMYLAEGLVVYGGAVLWKRGRMVALLPMVAGCLIAVATRPYAGWFLTAAAAAVVLHASLTRQRGLRSLALTTTCVVLIGVSGPVVWDASSTENLRELQQSQDANARSTSNLALEWVDYSTRERMILNLPQRVRDVVLRPYLWQTENASQQLGAIGTLVVLGCIAMLLISVVRDPRAIMRQAAPFVYPAAFMLIAYSLSAGNAGTAYRYRTHLVGMAIGLTIVLVANRRQEKEGLARVPRRPGLAPISPTRTAA